MSFCRQQPSLSHDGTEASLEHAETEVDAACIVTSFQEHGFEGRAVEGKQEMEEWCGRGGVFGPCDFPVSTNGDKG